MNDYISFNTTDEDLTFIEFKKRSLLFIKNLSISIPYCNKLFFLKSNIEIDINNSTINEQLYNEINDDEVAYINANKSNKDLMDESKSPFGFSLDFATKKESEGLGFWFSLYGGNEGNGGGKIEFIGDIEKAKLLKTYEEILLIAIKIYRPNYGCILNSTIRKQLRVKGQKTCGLYSYINRKLNVPLPHGFKKSEVLGDDTLIESNFIDISIDDLKKVQEIINRPSDSNNWTVFDGL
nr:hypothetical protein [Pedobacter sp. ASV2]